MASRFKESRNDTCCVTAQEIQRDSKEPSWVLACQLTKQNTRFSRQPGFGFGWKVWKFATTTAPYCITVEGLQFSSLPPVDLSNHQPRWGLGLALIGTLERRHPVKRTPVGLFCAAVESCSPKNPQEPPVTATGKWGMLKQMGGKGGIKSCWVWSFFERQRRKSDNGMSPSVTVPVTKFFLMSSEHGSKRRR